MRQDPTAYVITIDFAKLYNSWCPDVTTRIAAIMGLQVDSMPILFESLKRSEELGERMETLLYLSMCMRRACHKGWQRQ